MLKFFKKRSIKKQIEENNKTIQYYEDQHYKMYGHNNYNKFYKQRLDFYRRENEDLALKLKRWCI